MGSMQQQIQELLTQSEEIAEQVRCNNWSTVQDLAAERQRELEALFAQKITPDQATEIASMTRKILAIDKTLVDYIEKEKQQTFESFASMKNQVNAKSTYDSVATMNG